MAKDQPLLDNPYGWLLKAGFIVEPVLPISAKKCTLKVKFAPGTEEHHKVYELILNALKLWLKYCIAFVQACCRGLNFILSEKGHQNYLGPGFANVQLYIIL